MATTFTETSLSTTYKDDFRDSDNFHRILFNTGVGLQARELTQLQTILQKQIERFGNNVFKEGAVVQPGGTNINPQYEFIKLDTNCVKFVALWDSQTIADEIGKSKKWVFLNYTVDVWDKSTSNKEKNKITKLRASSYAELLGFNGEDYLIKAPMDNKIGWINKKHVKVFSMKNRVTKKLCN